MLAILNMRRINPVNVLLASLAATVVVTITMLMSGTDIIKVLGGMLLGTDASVTARYFTGGVVHLLVGIAYGVFFALFFAPISEWNKITKGVIFGFFITVMALVFMPLGASMLSGKQAVQTANPCAAVITNSCNPCMPRAVNPCKMNNPCATKSMNPCSVGNPCAVRNPCSGGRVISMKMVRPSNPCTSGMSNPCAASNPCGGGGGNAYGGLISLGNHIGLALVLAFGIRLRTDASDKRA